MPRLRLYAAAVCLLGLAAPALSRDLDGRDGADDIVVVGAGLGSVPDYEGSDHNRFVPVPGAVGRIAGYKFFYLGNQASMDLIRDKGGPGWDFQLGPSASVGFNRATVKDIDDARIRALGKIGLAVELGGYVGVARQGVLTSAYDRLSLTVNWRHDVAGAHGGSILIPTLSYMTPLSRKAMVTAFVSASHVDDKYADTYFSITPAQSAASTLPVYTAKAGWKSFTVGAATAVSLTGDLTHGLSVVGGVGYSQLLGEFADSPVSRVAGRRDQWMFGLGLAYTF